MYCKKRLIERCQFIISLLIYLLVVSLITYLRTIAILRQTQDLLVVV